MVVLPKTLYRISNLAPLRTFVDGFVGPKDVRLRVCAISYRVIGQAKGIYLRDALLKFDESFARICSAS